MDFSLIATFTRLKCFCPCVVLGNIHTTLTEEICHMTPTPHWIFRNQSPKLSPPSLWNFQNFPTLPGYIAISYEGNRYLASFTRMPNFTSLMNFLLNSITDNKANSSCKFLMHSSHKQIL